PWRSVCELWSGNDIGPGGARVFDVCTYSVLMIARLFQSAGAVFMARVPYVEKGTADPEIRNLYEGFEAQFGVRGVPNVAKALANSPGLASKGFPLGNYC